MTITVPHSREITTLPQSFTVCVSSNPEERGRVVAALDGQGLVVLVPDARMAAEILARAGEPPPDVADDPGDVIRLDRLVVDRSRALVQWESEPLALSHLELEVLACLAAAPGVVWSYERLHEAAWGSRYVGDRDSVYSLVKRLRRKLADAGATIELIAVRGVGFQLVTAPGTTPALHVTGWGSESA